MASKRGRKRLNVPTTGMRGGLGRTLLTAFLVMTIGPLSVLSWYAARSGRRNIQRQVQTKLSTVVTVTEMRIREWTGGRHRALGVIASSPDVRRDLEALSSGRSEREDVLGGLSERLGALLASDPAFAGVTALDKDGDPLITVGSAPEGSLLNATLEVVANEASASRIVSLDSTAPVGGVVLRSIQAAEGEEVGGLAGWFSLGEMESLLASVEDLGDGSRVYVVDGSGSALPVGSPVDGEGIDAALADGEAGGFFDTGSGDQVIGAYRKLPDMGLVVAAEQPRQEALSGADRATAAIVAAGLVVALVTSVIAAVVTRQITGPVVTLTESVLRVAEGDLDERADIHSRDEIGILTDVFNRMVAELKSLYNDLEAKVAERTMLLRQANATIQKRAVHLATTVEISRAVTSILDPAKLLPQVVELIHEQFDYPYVGIYLLTDGGERAELEVGKGDGEGLEAARDHPVLVEGDSAVSRAIRSRDAVVERRGEGHEAETRPLRHIGAEVALPLTVRDDTLGVLDILTVNPDRIDDDTLSILRSVASQVAVALDNARAYRNERDARQRLKQAEAMRSRFLTHMSRELREPLTNIIGFCRLILNGLDGPISEQQRHDLQIVYANSEHLLGLINDLLDVSQIEAGLMELQFEEVDLDAMTRSVMATASALVRDKDIQLHREVGELPPVKADATRVRQVLLKLLTNAAKFTDQGTITIRAWSADRHVFVSVEDTGRGIPVVDQQRVFERFEQGANEHGLQPNGIGLGLSLSKEFVEMHGGEIWVRSEPGKGSVFTFSLPLDPHAVTLPQE
jgi:signal transduction histidine kinase/HAMP domain-containing protein